MNKQRLAIAVGFAAALMVSAGMSQTPGKRELIVVGNDEKVSVNDAGAFDLVARMPIAAGEEITFDYAMRNYTIEHFPAVCRCGASLCRRSVTGWKDLPEERKAAYRGFVAPYLLEIDGS